LPDRSLCSEKSRDALVSRFAKKRAGRLRDMFRERLQENCGGDLEMTVPGKGTQEDQWKEGISADQREEKGARTQRRDSRKKKKKRTDSR